MPYIPPHTWPQIPREKVQAMAAILGKASSAYRCLQEAKGMERPVFRRLECTVWGMEGPLEESKEEKA